MKRFLSLLLLACAGAQGQQVDLTANVQGVLPIANGGTGNSAGVPTVGTLTYSDTGFLGALQGSTNGYAQFVLQNSSAGSTASSDFVVNNNLSTATAYYGDFGINSSTFGGLGSFSLPSATYLYSASGDLSLGTYTNNSIHFVVNNGAADAASISGLGNLTLNGYVTAPHLQTSGAIANALCSDGSGNIISNAAGNCYASAPYPGAGIANSTGSAWGTSYSTSGSGTTVCLSTSCVMTTPNLGTPSAATLTNATGLPLTTGVAGVLAGTNGGTGVNNGAKTITLGGNLTTSGAFNTTLAATATTSVTLPTSGTLIASSTPLSGPCTGTPSSSTYLRGDCTWATPTGSGAVINGYISGFTLSNDGTSPNTVLDIAPGYAADSANAAMITGTAFTKSTAGVFTAGTGNNGMGTGLAVSASTWYHVYAIVCSGAYDVYFDTSATAANAPACSTSHRYIGSFKTDASSRILAFTQEGQKFYWNVQANDVSTTTGVLETAFTVSSPSGFVTHPFGFLSIAAASANAYARLYPGIAGGPTGNNIDVQVYTQAANQSAIAPWSSTTNTSSQLYYLLINGSSYSLNIFTEGYVNPHVAATF